jgi:hypothetical protein
VIPTSLARSCIVVLPASLRFTTTGHETAMSPTLLLRDGFRFFFYYSRETTEPPHLHVRRADAEAKVWLSPVRLEESHGFTSSQLARIERVVRTERRRFLAAWRHHFEEYPEQRAARDAAGPREPIPRRRRPRRR